MATPLDSDFTEEERQALFDLRVSIQDVLKERTHFDNDHFLIKWLRARRLNTHKTEKMIRNNRDYYELYGLNYIDKWLVPEVMKRYIPHGNFGEDREQYPIQYMRFGRLDLHGITQASTRVELIRHMHKRGVELDDRYAELSQKWGKRIDKMVLVVDLEGLGMQHFNPRALSIFRSLVRASEDNYPETMVYIHVITNSPFFHLAWEVAGHFIDEGTKKKIKFYRPNECEENLRRYIAPEKLPQCYGGTACYPDTFCTDFLGMGGIVPEKYYLKNILEIERQSELTLVRVRARTTAQVPIVVRQSRAILCWIFKTESYDINFGIYFHPGEEVVACHTTELNCVHALQRCDSQVVPDKGDIMCMTPGTYILYWDNTYSWFRNKEVQYICDLVEPDTAF